MNAPAIISIGPECSPPRADDFQAAAARLRDACQDAWLLIDQLGPHASDEHKLEVLKGPKFASAAFSVRAALVFTRHLSL